MPYAVIEEKYTDNTVNGTATLKELNMLCKTVTPRPCWDLSKFAILFFKFDPKRSDIPLCTWSRACCIDEHQIKWDQTDQTKQDHNDVPKIFCLRTAFVLFCNG